MKFDENFPPRTFKVGKSASIEISDCGDVYLEPDEQITFKTEAGHEYDFSKKNWGFYVSPSLNSRLLNFGLRVVLVKNVQSNHFFLMAVEKGKEKEFKQYLSEENMEIITSLASNEILTQLEKYLKSDLFRSDCDL